MNLHRTKVLVLLTTAACALALMTGIASADRPTGDTELPRDKAGTATTFNPAAPTDPRGPRGQDDASLDVGVEFTADDPPPGPGGADLPGFRTGAFNFYNRMRAAGYNGPDSFIYGDSSAWEQDWKRFDAPGGGTENSYVDNVDIAYYLDHGNNGALYFAYDHDDKWLVPTDCTNSWGDKDAEWIGFSSCLTLTDQGGWANCMNGLHLLTGYITISYSYETGGMWADQMLGWYIDLPLIGRVWLRSPKTITQAWFTTCDAYQPSSVTARVIAEDSRHFNDKLWGRGGPAYGDIVDNTYWWMDHHCWKADPIAVNTSPLAEIPAYGVVQRTVDQGYAQNLARTLGFGDNPDVRPNDSGTEWAITSTANGVTRTLSVATASGGYTYQNLSELWLPPAPGQPLTLPSPDQAQQLADTYFLANAQNLPGVRYRTDPMSTTESVASAEKHTVASSGASGAPGQTTTGVDVMVGYGRRLAITGVSSARDTVTTDVSVVGPGSSTKLYYGQPGGRSQAAPGSRPQTEQLPIGLLGGSRDVVRRDMITIQSADSTWTAYLNDHQIAVVTPPIQADEIIRDPVEPTLGYYEQPHDVPQQELIPVWIYRATFKQQGAVVASNVLVYVPVSPDYYPPTVTITSPAAGTTIRPGARVDFAATAEGPFGPFTFQWESNRDGVLGTGASLTHTLSPSIREDQIANHTISVKVTNANGQTRVVNTTVSVSPYPVYLPGLYNAFGDR